MIRGFRRRNNIGLLLLFIELFQFGFDRIPPVTLGTIAFNVAVFLGVVHPFFSRSYPHALEICVGVNQVWNRGDYWRILESTFYHADDMHLYFNMVSFLWKGKSLERRFGSGKFLYMLAIFSVLVNTVLLYLNYAAAVLFQDPSYLSQCAVGFSGVVFAVKVVTTQMLPPGRTLVMGIIPINSRWACWLELLLIQILVPNASFTGHLAGILVGLAFTKTPLKAVLDWPFSEERRYGPSYTYYRGTASPNDSASTDSFTRFTGGVSEDDQMKMAMEESLRSNYSRNSNIYPNLHEDVDSQSAAPTAPPFEPSAPSYGWNIPSSRSDTREDVRRRRLDHYG